MFIASKPNGSVPAPESLFFRFDSLPTEFTIELIAQVTCGFSGGRTSTPCALDDWPDIRFTVTANVPDGMSIDPTSKEGATYNGGHART